MPTYSELVRADGATNHWRLNETTGTLAADAIGSAHGTLSGGVTLGQPGAVLGDGAMAFNGSTGKIVTASIAVTVPVTIEAWLRFDVDVVQRPVLSVSGGGTFLYIGVNSNTAFVFMNGGSSSGTNIRTGWHHVVYVLTPTSETFYVDGVLTVTTVGAAVVAPITGPVVLGFNAETGEYWNGSLDEVAIYPVALSPAQILAHYQARVYPYAPGSYAYQVIQGGASNFWRLSETSGTTAVDIVGGANGVISGGVTLGQGGATSDGDKAMAFDAANDYVSVAAGTYLAVGTGSFTLECWTKPVGAYPATPPFVLETSGGANGAGFAFLFGSSTAVTFKVANGTTAALATVPYPTDGRWHHVVGVLTRGTPDRLQVFVDGVGSPVTNPAANGWNITSPLALLFGTYSGGQASPDYRYFGSLDDIAIYPRALTAPEIAAHAVAGRSLPSGDKTTLLHNWQEANQAWNNEEIAAALGAMPPADVTTALSRFLWPLP